MCVCVCACACACVCLCVCVCVCARMCMLLAVPPPHTSECLVRLLHLCSITAAVPSTHPTHPFIFFHPHLSFSFFLQAKTTKKIVLRMECTVQECKRKKHKALKRCKHFELGGDKKRKVGSHNSHFHAVVRVSVAWTWEESRCSCVRSPAPSRPPPLALLTCPSVPPSLSLLPTLQGQMIQF